MKKAGIDTESFKPHSTRAASTSAAFREGIPLETIMAAAEWYFCHLLKERCQRGCYIWTIYTKPLAVMLSFTSMYVVGGCNKPITVVVMDSLSSCWLVQGPCALISNMQMRR